MAWVAGHSPVVEIHIAARALHRRQKIRNEMPCVLSELLFFENRIDYAVDLAHHMNTEREMVALLYDFVNCVAAGERNQHAARCPRACGGKCSASGLPPTRPDHGQEVENGVLLQVPQGVKPGRDHTRPTHRLHESTAE
jgi:hypothetical protein